MNNFLKSIFLLFILCMSLFSGPKVDAQSWNIVGTANFSMGEAWYSSIAIDKDGTPYVSYMDGSFTNNNATVMKYNGSDWVTVGTAGFTDSEVRFTSIVVEDTTPFIAFMDFAHNRKSTVMKYNGSDWITVGAPGFSGGFPVFISMTKSPDGTLYVAYEDIPILDTDEGPATVMKYDGTNWITVGSSGFSAGTAFYTSIAIDSGGIPYVVYSDIANASKATVMKFDGSAWVNVGSAGFSAALAANTSIAIDKNNTPYVAYSDYGNGERATVMKFNGTDWVNVGTAGFSVGVTSSMAITIDSIGSPFVAYNDAGSGHKVTVMKYDGTNWADVGSPGFSALNYEYEFTTGMAMSSSGVPYVLYSDKLSNKTTVMSYETATGVKHIRNPAETSLSIFSNPNHGTFTLNISSPITQTAAIIITNAIGQKVKELTIPVNKDIHIQLDTSPGVYFLSATAGNEKLNSKIVVE